MQFYSVYAEQLDALCEQLKTSEGAQLILCYATANADDLAHLCQAIQSHQPDARVIGVTTEEAIQNGQLVSSRFCVTQILLTDEEEKPNIICATKLDPSHQRACQAWLDEQTHGVLVAWGCGDAAQLDQFISGLNTHRPLVGGVAGRCKNGDQALWCQGQVFSQGLIMVSLAAGEIQFEPCQDTGWLAVTRTHRITRAEGARVYEIDHHPARRFYEHYLQLAGLSNDRLAEVGLAFPLMVSARPGHWQVRGVIGFHDDGSLTCVGKVPEGAAVKLAVGSVSRRLSSISPTVCQPDQAALVFFCAGRKLVLKEYTTAALRSFGHCVSTGFFSFGEIFGAAGGHLELLNHTSVYLLLKPKNTEPLSLPEENRSFTILPDTADLLVNLLNRVYEETEQVEQLLTLASHLIVRFEQANDGRWWVNQVLGKSALLAAEAESLLKNEIDPVELLDGATRERVEDFLTSKQATLSLHGRICHAGQTWWPVRLVILRQKQSLFWLIEDLSAQQALARLSEMFEQGPVVQFEWLSSYHDPVRYVSPNVEQVLGLSYDQLVNEKVPFSTFIYPDDLHMVEERFRRYLQDKIRDFQQEYRLKTPHGIRWVRDYTHVVYDDQDQPEAIFGFVLNITQEKLALLQLEKEKQQAAWKAVHDPLTNLYNRTYVYEFYPVLLEQIKRCGGFLIIFMIDLDNFKEINDVHGHSAGDQVLCEFARRLKVTLRKSDVVSRFGGDEFIVLSLIKTQHYKKAENGARIIAQKIFTVLKQPFEVGGELFNLSASMGIVLIDETIKEDIETLIRYADTSMYLAKRSGRNRYRFFEQKQQAEEEERAKKRAALRQAIDNQELWLAYQPQVCWRPESGLALQGAEVLLRWQSRQFGFVSPGEFIPLAEESGLILTLGDWMIERALAQLSDWQQRQVIPPDFVLSLNISALQFYQDGFSDRLCVLCEQYGLAPEQIRLELTERIVYKSSESALQRIEALRALGFSTSLDDFGTGYSSLAYLKRMALDELKIDRTFVASLLEDETNRVLTQTILDLAHNFNLNPIAEGTEQKEEVRALIEMGCRAFQGYYFAKPMSAQDFEQWWADAPLEKFSLQCG